jgi:hypothetical protein
MSSRNLLKKEGEDVPNDESVGAAGDSDVEDDSEFGGTAATGDTSKGTHSDADLECMRKSRIAVYITLVIMAAIAGAITYVYRGRDEQDDFEDRVSCCFY